MVDDDEYVRFNWKNEAKKAGINLLALNHPDSLLEKLPFLSKDITIYMDSYLGESMRGEDIARAIYSQGFRNIIITTGFPAERFQGMDFITDVIQKDPPFERSTTLI